MLELNKVCAECNIKFNTDNNLTRYCSPECKKKHYLKLKKERVMSKLCPKCRKNYIYIGSKGCNECLHKGKYGKLSSKASNNRYKKMRRLKYLKEIKSNDTTKR